jgi:hypothetical protein
MPSTTQYTPDQVKAYLDANPQIRDSTAAWLQQQGNNTNVYDWVLGDMNNDPQSVHVGQFNSWQSAGSPSNTGGAATTGGGTTSTAGGTGNGLTSLVAPSTTASVDPATATAAGGNYNQTQNSNQAGAFGTVGTTDQTTNQTQTQAGSTTGTQSSTGTQNTIGTTAQNTTTGNTSATTGQQTTQGTTQGTSTTAPVDTLGFGSLLQGAANSANTNDAARSAFLNDVMNTGGQQFGSQVDQAVRNSLTGPQMTGAGDSARARAAGYAGAQVGRNNLDERLAASQQLAGPTGLTQLASAANPYIGQTSSTTGSNTGNTTSLGSQIDSGFSSLLGSNTGQTFTNALQNSSGTSSNTGTTAGTSSTNEAQAGSTAAASSQAGAGEIPQGQPVKTGGCVLCTAGIELKLPKSNMHRVLRRVIKHKLQTETSRFAAASRGYFFLFTPFARFLLVHRWIASLLWPLARAVVYEELRISGQRLPFRAVAWGVHWLGHGVCVVMGKLPVADHVTDPLILKIAEREKILFEVKGGTA